MKMQHLMLMGLCAVTQIFGASITFENNLDQPIDIEIYRPDSPVEIVHLGVYERSESVKDTKYSYHTTIEIDNDLFNHETGVRALIRPTNNTIKTSALFYLKPNFYYAINLNNQKECESRKRLFYEKTNHPEWHDPYCVDRYDK